MALVRPQLAWWRGRSVIKLHWLLCLYPQHWRSVYWSQTISLEKINATALNGWTVQCLCWWCFIISSCLPTPLSPTLLLNVLCWRVSLAGAGKGCKKLMHSQVLVECSETTIHYSFLFFCKAFNDSLLTNSRNYGKVVLIFFIKFFILIIVWWIYY